MMGRLHSRKMLRYANINIPIGRLPHQTRYVGRFNASIGLQIRLIFSGKSLFSVASGVRSLLSLNVAYGR
jgi:hypothetical protein